MDRFHCAEGTSLHIQLQAASTEQQVIKMSMRAIDVQGLTMIGDCRSLQLVKAVNPNHARLSERSS